MAGRRVTAMEKQDRTILASADRTALGTIIREGTDDCRRKRLAAATAVSMMIVAEPRDRLSEDPRILRSS